MAGLSITKAWNETATFVRREGQLLFPLAFMLIALPVALLEIFTPAPPAPNQAPAAGLWLALLPAALVASMIGNLAISYLAIRPGASVGEAIRRGVQRFLPLLLAVVMLGFVAIIVLFIILFVVMAAVPGAAEAAAAGVQNEAFVRAVGLAMLVLLPLLLFFSARLILMNPATANEEGGPLAMIRRSWSLTAGHGLKLVGLILVTGIVYLAASAALQSVAGLAMASATGSIRPGSLGALLVSLCMAGLNTIVTPYLTTLIARVYAQLAPTVRNDVFS